MLIPRGRNVRRCLGFGQDFFPVHQENPVLQRITQGVQTVREDAVHEGKVRFAGRFSEKIGLERLIHLGHCNGFRDAVSGRSELCGDDFRKPDIASTINLCREMNAVRRLLPPGGEFLHLRPGNGNPDFGNGRFPAGLVQALNPIKLIRRDGHQGDDGQQGQKI